MKESNLFNPKRDDFLVNVSMILKLSSKKLDMDNKLLIKTCLDLSKKFKDLHEKNYRLAKKIKK